jgi:hypothetical protein
MEPGGENFSALFKTSPDRSPGEPYLSTVAAENADRVGVSGAEYSRDDRALRIVLKQVGDPALLRDAPPVQVTLKLGNTVGRPRVEVSGAPLEEGEYTRGEQDLLSFPVEVAASGETVCVVRV